MVILADTLHVGTQYFIACQFDQVHSPVLQVLIKVQASGVNPVDTYIRSGAYGRLPQLPYIPGSDAAGVVEAVGQKVTNFKVKDSSC